MKTTAFKCLTHALQADFGYATEQFKRNSGASSYNALTAAALALQQVEWLGRTSTVPASEKERIAKEVFKVPCEHWGRLVVAIANEIHKPA